MSVQEPIDSQSANTTSHIEQNEFTPFPKLPLELRLKIWKSALPNGANDNGERIICLRLHTISADGDNSLDARFTVGTNGYEMDDRYGKPGRQSLNLQEEPDALERITVNVADITDVSLLRTCTESRTEVLRAFKNTLPMMTGEIRFDDEATIFIENLFPKMRYYGVDIDEGIAQAGGIFPPSFGKIRNLATFPIENLSLRRLYSAHARLALFPQLETLKFSLKTLRAMPYKSFGLRGPPMICGRDTDIEKYLQQFLQTRDDDRKASRLNGAPLPKLGYWEILNGRLETTWVSRLGHAAYLELMNRQT